jgi:hypothetical protein
MENNINSTTDKKEVPPMPINFPKKNLKDYFFDFFMLFFAVTLGFFVNNLSSDLQDRHREKQYMISLINDLKIDTAQINSIYSETKNRIIAIDSLLYILENKNQSNFINNLIYFSIKYLNSAAFFTNCDRTITQLKSAGELRLIQKAEVSDSIVQYYGSSENVKYNTEACLKEFNRISDFEKEMFDFESLRGHYVNTIKQIKGLKLLYSEPVRINHYYNQILTYKSSLINYNMLITDLRREAESLINLSRKKYKLK